MKNLLPQLAMLVLVTPAFAQLYVKPNATTSTDSYIYVNDQVLFVEQDVNLVENTNDPTTKASIYLRNQSQLVQGTSSSSNSGSGYISIFQDSHADSYDYNYWCSPVGNTPASIGNKNFGITKMYDSLSVTNSTVTLNTVGYNGASSPLTISTRWFYRWNPVTQRWIANGTGNTVPPGYGFIMKGTDVTVHADPYNEPQNQKYDFRGRPNNGDITLPVETTGIPFTDGTSHYFTLAGNPYPSALDLNLVFNDPDNVEIDSFKYWDEDRSINSHLYIDNKGGYGTWIPGPTPYVDGGLYTLPTFMNYDSGGNPTTSTGVSGVNVERLYAPVGQGFMISANSGNSDDGFITIKNSHRVYLKEGVSNLSEFRNNENAAPKLRIHAIFGDNSHFRDMLLVFDDNATYGFDRGLDASHPMDAAISEAFFPIGNSPDTRKNLVIQTVPFDYKQQIPITFRLQEQTKVTLKAAEEINVPYAKVFLYDKLNDTYKEIQGDVNWGSSSLASVILPAGNHKDRFYITFASNIPNDGDLPGGDGDVPVTSRSGGKTIEVDFFQNNPARQLEVSNPEGYDIKLLNIFDMSGKLVYTQQNVGNSTRLTFPTYNLSDGVYLVKLTTVDNQTIDYKTNIFNK